MSTKTVNRAKLVSLSAVALMASATFGWMARPTTAAAVEARPPADNASLVSLSDAFASVAERVKPSVVYITASRPAEVARAPFPIPPEFQRFFEPGQPQPRQPSGRTPLETSSGSGFIVSPDGYILTNHHVVAGARRVRVRMLDRRELDAKVVGSDPATDVALLKVEASGLTAADLGSSTDAKVGQWVLAVGNPFGENLTFTVTSGIISAKGRALELPNQSSRSIQDFIQTDAAINPGNSGGPLVDISGRVIGINSAIASPTGTYSGYGFAVPIDLARHVMEQLIASGHVDRVAIGILARNATEEDAAYAGLDEVRGVLVQDFAPDSPAKAAGIRAGDLIIAVDGQPVDYVAQLQERIGFRHPGDVVTIEVARKHGARSSIRVKLQRAPEEVASAAGDGSDRASPDDAVSLPSLGVSLVPLTGGLVAQLELPAGTSGLLVADVIEDGPAAGRLATPDNGGPDVIQQVEGQPVRTMQEVKRALSAAGKGEIVSLTVYNGRADGSRVVRIKLAGQGG